MRYRLPNPASLTPDERHTYRLAFAGKHAESFEHLGDGSLIATGVRPEGVRSLYFLAAFLGKSIRPAAAISVVTTARRIALRPSSASRTLLYRRSRLRWNAVPNGRVRTR